MAALTLAVGTATTLVFPALGADKPAPPNKVKLALRIAGLGKTGCEVVIKPGHAGRFQAVTLQVKKDGYADVILKDVTTESADRECDFAITIREPGQPPRTFHRGLRLAASKDAGSISPLTCFLNSPSSLANIDKPTRRQ